MASTPFTPSRNALNDISNRKRLQSALKTPLRPPEELEKIQGKSLVPSELPLETCLFGLMDSRFSPELQVLENESISAETSEFFEADFEKVDAEIDIFLNSGVFYNSLQ